MLLEADDMHLRSGKRLGSSSERAPDYKSAESQLQSDKEKNLDEDEDEVDDEPIPKRSRRGRSDRASIPPPKQLNSRQGRGDNKKVIISVKKERRDGSPNNQKPVATTSEGSKVKGESGISDVKKERPDESSPISEAASEPEDELDASEEEEERADVVIKARETVRSTLKTSVSIAYPDWQPQEPVPYAALCTTFSLIELTSKRLIILSLCAQFLRQVLRLTPSDLLPTVQLMINKLAADSAGIELGIGESLIMKAIGETTGRSLATIKADHNEIGDLGLVAAKSRSNQPTMFKPKPLSVRGVHEGLMAVATVTGNGAQNRKIAGIKKLLSAADAQIAGKDKGVDITKDKGGPSEAKYLVRFLEGKLRLGLAEKTVLVALAQAMVAHEAELKSKIPSTEQLAEGEAILKTVYRYRLFVLCRRGV